MGERVGPTRSLLRFMTCGSVDDGKSTLIGRMLYECGAIFDDQLVALKRDSDRYGTQPGAIDFSLLLDGLQAEREQAITIDVAYRFFETPARRFVVADAPGHEEYTRNMVTAASTADLAVLLVDATKGLLTQTRRHAYVATMVGVRRLVLAVNKMDLVGYEYAVFERLAEEFTAFARDLGLGGVTCIPVSAVKGDNVATLSASTPWYRGLPLLACLETVEVTQDLLERSFRLPVQLVQRPNHEFRGYSGTIVSGRVRAGDPVVVAPSGRVTRVARIVTADGDLEEAMARQAVTLTLADDLDVGRGDVIAAGSYPPEHADQFMAHLFWMPDTPMLSRRRYLIRVGHQLVTGQVTELKHRVNVNTLQPEVASRLDQNEIGYGVLAVDRAIAFDRFSANRGTGSFIMIDPRTNNTVAGGTITIGVPRAVNVGWQTLTVDKAARAGTKGHKACVVWLTGLSAAGKSTIANLVEAWLAAHGHHTYLLDGDNLRHGLNRDLGFSDEDRVENVRRVAEVARLMVDAGLIVLVSLISPFRAERLMARDIVEEGEFFEMYVDTPLAVCEARDPKGLYRRARAGEITNFTGIDSAYEPPLNQELTLAGAGATPDELARQVIARLRARGVID